MLENFNYRSSFDDRSRSIGSVAPVNVVSRTGAEINAVVGTFLAVAVQCSTSYALHCTNWSSAHFVEVSLRWLIFSSSHEIPVKRITNQFLLKTNLIITNLRCLSGFVPDEDFSYFPPTRRESTQLFRVSIVEDQVLEFSNVTRLIDRKDDEKLTTVGRKLGWCILVHPSVFFRNDILLFCLS